MNARLMCASIFTGLAMTSNPAFGAGDPELKRENFQKEIDGKKVDLYTIKRKSEDKGEIVVRGIQEVDPGTGKPLKYSE